MRRFGLACAALLLLSACQSNPEPIEPTATRPASPSTTDEPKATPPTLPAIAKRNDETGAANFVVYWVKVSNYAARTGETDLLREISTENCEGCRRYIELYDKTYGAGGYFKGGDRQLRNIQTQSDHTGTYVIGRLVAQPGRFRKSASEPEKGSSAETTQVTFVAQFTNGAWAMADVGLSA